MQFAHRENLKYMLSRNDLFLKIRISEYFNQLPLCANVSHLSLPPQRAVVERLRCRSREQKVPSSIPRSDISIEVTSQC